ncbi:LacI family DNA-binding transcriptional regulator [Bifidobacterium asteroides]|uniref:LacI family DNA-binding transcriptional regulator n=1 Tax=Bifidobacterium asteroides TaxID=1684 RepID=A0A6N7TYV0_9BIFI|nr:LacI family DNA-binding transcriptional regulator [Bifidobacterium asteroides]MSD91658.1 LacI family DNA-binding transcriptional regulator [Bifidobacterium asteroides]
MGATIQEVAAAAHVSVSTVSRAFNRPDLVSAKTRHRVIEMARKLDFTILRSATALKSGRAFRIALLVSGPIRSWFNASILEGLNAVLRPAEYDLAIWQIGTYGEQQCFFDDLPERRNVDAVIVSSFDIKTREIDRLATMGVPLIGINSPIDSRMAASVNTDDLHGGTIMANHLMSLGHQNIVFVATRTAEHILRFSANRRWESFARTCKLKGINPRLIMTERKPNMAEVLSDRLLTMKSRPTAVACQDDEIAIPLLLELRRRNVAVPGQFSIIGFDDSRYAREMGLTTIRQLPIQLGIITGAKILDLLSTGKTNAPFESCTAALIERSSTAPPKNLDAILVN